MIHETQTLYDFDDFTALRDEILARPLNDVLNELTILRQGARSAIMGNMNDAIHTFDGWRSRFEGPKLPNLTFKKPVSQDSD